MNTTSQFTNSFWSIYIVVIVVLGLTDLAWLPPSQNIVKRPKKGEEVKTTGHERSGISEYNNPLPRWWFWLYICTWLFGVGYLIIYPGIGDYKDLWGWSNHGQYEEGAVKANQQHDKAYAGLSNTPIEKVVKDPETHVIAQSLSNTCCTQYHGPNAESPKGFPNLTDDDWLWDGEPEKVQEVIEKGRAVTMKVWGPELGEERVKDVAHYVMSLSKSKDQYDEERAARDKVLFNDPPTRCFTCHGDEGRGIQGVAPNLTDNVWLWGDAQKSIIETITNSRHSQVPAWGHFFDKDKLHIMTTYVWGLSDKGGKKAPAKKAKPAPAAQPADVSVPMVVPAPAADKAASDAKVAPAAEAKPAEEAGAVPTRIDGRAVFEANYKVCYGDMVPGALTAGKKDNWTSQVKQGRDALHKHALGGFNSMPAKGGNGSSSDDEVKAAADFIVNEFGAKF